MISPLQKIPLRMLIQQPTMFDANIFMVGVENRISDPNCSFENMKQLYMIPLFESFAQIIIHEMVYFELDVQSRDFVDGYVGKNVTIVKESGLYGTDPTYTMIFNEIANDLETLKSVEVITFDIIVLLAYIYYMNKGDISHNKALKSLYKRYCEDVIKRHKLPATLREYFQESVEYI